MPTPKNRTVRKKAGGWYLPGGWLDELPAGDPARALLDEVAAHPEQHCRWVHLACRRHVLDLRAAAAGGPWVYEPGLAARCIAFAREFAGVEGPLAGQPLTLLPWQAFVVAQLWGWRRRDDPRKRRFSYAYVSVPRKNGKTGFVAVLGLYQLTYPPPGARCDVYSAATKEDQAKIVWRDAVRLLKTAPDWAGQYRPRHNTLHHGPSDSMWRPLGSDSQTLDGLRPELAIADELHAWPSRGLWDVIDSAFGAAFSPLLLAITTSGDNPEGICMEQERRVQAVLEAVETGAYRGTEPATDEGMVFGAIWTLDEGDRWDDPEVWRKANPSLGTVKEPESMAKLAAAAQGSPGARRNFLIKQLNVWQMTGATRWLDAVKWDAAGGDPAKDQAAMWARLRGRRVWGGLDVSSTTDTTAFCLVADGDEPGTLLVGWRVWLPGDELAARCARDNQPYDLWAREGWLDLTPGDVIDVNQIVTEIVDIVAAVEGECGGIAYDPGWSQGTGIRLKDEHGLPMLVCAQRYSTMTAPLVELERLVIAGQLRHQAHPVGRAHALAARVQQGGVGGLLLAKGKSTGRIDMLAALAMALAARRQEQEEGGPPAAVGVFFAGE